METIYTECERSEIQGRIESYFERGWSLRDKPIPIVWSTSAKDLTCSLRFALIFER